MKYANQFPFQPNVPKSAYAHLSNVLKGEQAGQEVSSDMATAQREVLISSACIKSNREVNKTTLLSLRSHLQTRHIQFI